MWTGESAWQLRASTVSNPPRKPAAKSALRPRLNGEFPFVRSGFCPFRRGDSALAWETNQHPKDTIEMKPHRGTLILVLGILSLVFCGVFTAIPAWVMGSSDLKEMDAGLMDPTGRSITNVGKILGIVSVSLTVLAFVAGVVLMAFGLLTAPHSVQ
jgi:hypothetical protein